MLKYHQKVSFFLLVNTIIFSIAVYYISIIVFRKGKLLDTEDKKKLCYYIKNIVTANESIIIHFNKSISSYNPWLIASFFSLDTAAYKQPLYYPQKAVNFASIIDDYTLVIKFPYLFITNYHARLFCNEPTENIKEQKTSAQRYPITINLHDFQPGLTESQLKCDRSPVKQCIGTNISLRGQSLIINNPAIYNFPQNFLSLGGRINTSFYKMAKIDSTQTIYAGNPFQMAADYVTDRVVVIGTLGTARSQSKFINRLLDLYIPLDYIFKSEDPKNQKIHSYLDLNPSIEIDPFLRSITNESYNTQMNTHTTIFDRVILGLQKFDNFDINYLSSPYTSTSLIIHPGLLRSHFNLSETVPNLITVLLPPDDKIVNITSSLKNIKSNCTKCNIQFVNFSSLIVQKIINTVSKSKVLIAARYYGSELSYFMNPGSILLEISQNMFDCDERTKLLAQSAGVSYYNLGSSASYDFGDCQNNCNSPHCFDMVSASNLHTEPAMFDSAWDVAFKQIQES